MAVPTLIRRHWLILAIAVIVVLPVAYVVLKTTVALHYSYSDGDRAGYLQKLSRRGWLCKTWEGELLLTAMPGTAPEKFDFSTRSDSIAAELNKLNGQHVSVHYQQHKGVPTSCFGDTDYFVTGVRAVP
jgi:hypothetical protein